VTSHCCSVDEVICQQLDPATTTRSGLGHRRRADRLRILDLRRADDHLQTGFWQRVVPSSSSCRGSFSGGHLQWLGGFYGSLLSSRCHVLYGHRQRDLSFLGLSTCWQEDKCISQT
jgi:hypothetical protein